MDDKDAEARIAGGAAIGPELGARRKFWALLLVHTLLTGACIACCIYTLSSLHSQAHSELSDSKGIYLNMKKVSKKEPKLHFTVTWNKSMELNQESDVTVQFPGPYVFYVCALVTGKNGGKGSLILEQGKNKISIELLADSEEERYVRHERLVSLFENQVVTFSFSNPEAEDRPIIIKDLRIGLHYMLGAQRFNLPGL